MNCLNCNTDAGIGPFCSGACKHEYRSGQDPSLCAFCQDNKATNRGYCSLKCRRKKWSNYR